MGTRIHTPRRPASRSSSSASTSLGSNASSTGFSMTMLAPLKRAGSHGSAAAPEQSVLRAPPADDGNSGAPRAKVERATRRPWLSILVGGNAAPAPSFSAI